MSGPGLKVPRRAPQPRRSRAEQRAQTRERILDAAIVAIAELGLARATANEIARRAGVTWGAVQHHFGDKEALLAAVLEEGFERFARRFDDLPGEAPSLDERVDVFVERAWSHFRSPVYRANFEVLLGIVRDEPTPRSAAVPAQMLAAVDALWTRIFPDSSLGRGARHALERFVIATLSGLASNEMLQGPTPRVQPDVEIGLLKRTLARELGLQAGRSRSRDSGGDQSR